MRPTLLAIIGSLALAACKSPPVKPDVEMCFPQIMATLEESYCDCGMTAKGARVDLESLVGRTNKPLAYCDKATAFVPFEWEKVQVYIKLMEDYLRAECK